jgi:tetratricopeptide (TPR) repeat protein
MTREQRYELYIAALDKSLSSSEQTDFDILLQQPEFAQEYSEYCKLEGEYSRIEQQESAVLAFQQTIADAQKTLGNAPKTDSNTTTSSPPKLSFTRNLRIAVGVAACFTIGFLLFNGIGAGDSSLSTLFQNNFEPSILSAERGNNDSLSTAIVSLYSAAQYEQALPLLERYTSSHAQETKFKIALASCYIQAKQFDKAVVVLNSVIAQKDLYQEKAEWYLVLTYLADGKKEECSKLLSSFSATHFYADKATTLLQELK